MSDPGQRPLTLDEATTPQPESTDPDYLAWKDAKVRAAIKSADAGKFASKEDVRRVMKKYVPNG